MLTYARLLVGDLVSEPWCLYLDADTVLRENPAKLWMLAKQHPETVLFAAANYPNNSFRKQIEPQAPELVNPEPANDCYFNNGVLMINVSLWRERRLSEAIMQLTARHRFIAHEQDAANVLLRDDWHELPGRWNFQLYQRHSFPDEAAILHYSGRNKPWHYGYPRSACRPFLDALESAGWVRWRSRRDFRQWLRNSRFQPTFAQWNYRLRRWFGLDGIKPR